MERWSSASAFIAEVQKELVTQLLHQACRDEEVVRRSSGQDGQGQGPSYARGSGSRPSTSHRQGDGVGQLSSLFDDGQPTGQADDYGGRAFYDRCLMEYMGGCAGRLHEEDKRWEVCILKWWKTYGKLYLDVARLAGRRLCV